MKNLYYLSFFCFIAMSACKKGVEPTITKPSGTGTTGTTDTTTTSAATHLPLTVRTIAGTLKGLGDVDGDSSLARFNSPTGIDVLDDGTIYIADTQNGKIRKITPKHVVSTVNIPNSTDGQSLSSPSRVRVQADGTINILTLDVSSVAQHKIWIVKPDGSVITPSYKTAAVKTTYSPYNYDDLEKDPFNNALVIGGLYNDQVTAKPLLEKFQVNQGKIGTFPYSPSLDSLTADNKNSPEITSFFCGYNGTRFIVINSNAVYKYTPSGTFTQIFKDFQFKNITSIIATGDTRTVYIADSGKIESIFNGKLQYLVGPNSAYTGESGVGSGANVHANQLALSKDESTIYFTNGGAVRELLLK